MSVPVERLWGGVRLAEGRGTASAALRAPSRLPAAMAMQSRSSVLPPACHVESAVLFSPVRTFGRRSLCMPFPPLGFPQATNRTREIASENASRLAVRRGGLEVDSGGPDDVSDGFLQVGTPATGAASLGTARLRAYYSIGSSVGPRYADTV